MDAVIAATLAEHRAIADTLALVGPGGATVIEGWTTTELAAHLASLEVAGGIPLFIGRQLITRVHPRPTKGSLELAGRALERARARGYERCVERIRSPYRLPMRAGGAPVAIFEVFVHHQDVLRADPGLAARAAPPELAVSLPWLLAFHGKRLDGVRLELETDAGVQAVGDGAPVRVRGEVGEVVLWLAGRAAHCRVDVDADPDALGRVRPVTRI